MAPKPSGFLNSKDRVILVGDRGGFYVVTAKGIKRYGPVATRNSTGKALNKRVRKTRKGNVPVTRPTVKQAAMKRAAATKTKRVRSAGGTSYRNPFAMARAKVSSAALKAAAKKRAARNTARMVVSPGGKIYKNPFSYARSRRTKPKSKAVSPARVLPAGFNLYNRMSPYAAKKAANSRMARKAKMATKPRRKPLKKNPNSARMSPARSPMMNLLTRALPNIPKPRSVPSVENLKKNFGKRASQVRAKMIASGRPSTHYSKTTGKLKKNAPAMSSKRSP